MRNAVKQNVRVQRGGRIEVFVPEMQEGTIAEIIVLEAVREESAAPKPMLADVIGKGKGAFNSAQEVDRFIRAERDQWT